MPNTSLPAEDFVAGFPVSLDPDAIEHELSEMWARRGSQDAGEDSGAARITLGNVLWLGSSRHVPRIRAAFAKLVTRFPCRLFLLEYLPHKEGPSVDAFINAHCFLTPGMQREVCCEEIHLRFGSKGVPLVEGAVLPLLVPDVKTCLWWFTSTPDRYEQASEGLAQLADVVIREAAYLPDPAEGLRAMAQGPREVLDLAWVRTTHLREQLALLFDDPREGARLANIDRLELRWAGERDDPNGVVPASLLAGWLASRLGWKPAKEASSPLLFESRRGPVQLELAADAPRDGLPAGSLVSAHLHFRVGGCAKILLRPGGALQRIVEEADGSCPVGRRVLKSGPFDEAEALRAALQSRTGATLFRAAAACAWPLVRAILPTEAGAQGT